MESKWGCLVLILTFVDIISGQSYFDFVYDKVISLEQFSGTARFNDISEADVISFRHALAEKLAPENIFRELLGQVDINDQHPCSNNEAKSFPNITIDVSASCKCSLSELLSLKKVNPSIPSWALKSKHH